MDGVSNASNEKYTNKQISHNLPDFVIAMSEHDSFATLLMKSSEISSSMVCAPNTRDSVRVMFSSSDRSAPVPIPIAKILTPESYKFCEA